MKHTRLFFLVVAAVFLAACHDEPVVPTPGPVVRNVGYIACGDQHQVAVTGDDSWHSLLDTLFAAAESGCVVTFWNPDAFSIKQADTVTINTTDRREAYRWGEEMYDNGYIVSIVYDENTGTYRGAAIKSIPNPPQDTVMQELPSSEWWECTLTNLGPLEDGDNLLLNISWDSGMYYVHTTSMHGSPTLFYNELTYFHMSNDTMHCDNPVYSGLIWWIISYPDDSTMKMRTMFYAGHEVDNQVWLYQFRRLN
jgi:hypothetical protein